MGQVDLRFPCTMFISISLPFHKIGFLGPTLGECPILLGSLIGDVSFCFKYIFNLILKLTINFQGGWRGLNTSIRMVCLEQGDMEHRVDPCFGIGRRQVKFVGDIIHNLVNFKWSNPSGQKLPVLPEIDIQVSSRQEDTVTEVEGHFSSTFVSIGFLPIFSSLKVLLSCFEDISHVFGPVGCSWNLGKLQGVNSQRSDRV